MISNSSEGTDAGADVRLGARAVITESSRLSQARGHGLLALMILGYVGCAIVVARRLGVPERVNLASLSVIFPAIAVMFFLAILLWVLVV